MFSMADTGPGGKTAARARRDPPAPPIVGAGPRTVDDGGGIAHHTARAAAMPKTRRG